MRPQKRTEQKEAQLVKLTFLLCASAESLSAADQKVQSGVAAAVDARGGWLESVEGKWWLILFPDAGHPNERAAAAARCALDIRALLPGAPMALIADKAKSGLDPLIDRAVTTVTSESLASLFSDSLPAPGPPDGIRLDEATARLLETSFQVDRSSTGLYLRGELDSGSRHS
jgi:hypothetical protein